jgi:hypothetical protein
MRNAHQPLFIQHGIYDWQIRFMDGKKGLSHAHPKIIHMVIHIIPIQKDFPCQRVAIGMKTG